MGETVEFVHAERPVPDDDVRLLDEIAAYLAALGSDPNARPAVKPRLTTKLTTPRPGAPSASNSRHSAQRQKAR